MRACDEILAKIEIFQPHDMLYKVHDIYIKFLTDLVMYRDLTRT